MAETTGGLPAVFGLEGATPEEAAAVMAALGLYLSEDTAPQPVEEPIRWAAAGRLEAQGIPISRSTLSARWRQ